MNRIFILSLLVFSFHSLFAQIQDPVDVVHSVKRISDTEAELQVTATMDEGWHIYSTTTSDESMIIGTELNVPKSKDYRLIGSIKEPEPHTEYDPNFQEELSFHEGKVTFTQRIKIRTTGDFTIPAEFVYQVCNDEMCLPPEWVDVEFDVQASSESANVKGSKKN